MFVEISRGRSFKGLAQYCLHDVDDKTSERVSFVETRNLGTDNPQVAWRVMVARHYLQDELKEKAGVGKGGAKDGKPVGHLLISWKQDEAEAEELNRLSMMNAANGALRAIGASQHQAMIIGHTDTEHPHCHVIINLIGEDGRLKKNWKEKTKLSKFALQQEIKMHGEPVVKRREKNWLDREAGETPTPVKKKPRHLYELEKAAKQCSKTDIFAKEHLQKLAIHEKSKANQKQQHKRHQERLLWCMKERNRRTETNTEQKIRTSKTTIRKSYDQNWYELLNQQEADRREFEKNESNLKGSLANAMSLINWKQLLGRKREPNQLGLSDAFHILTSEASRRNELKKQQRVEQDQLRAKQRAEERTQQTKLQEEQTETIRFNRRAYVRKADAMKQRQARCRERLSKQQQHLTKERNAVLKKFRNRELEQKLVRQQANDNQASLEQPQETVQLKETTKPKRTRRTRKPRTERKPRQPRDQNKTRPIDVLPQDDNAKQVAKQMDDFEKRMIQQFKKRSRDKEQDR